MVDWDEISSTQRETWAHKSCKGTFFKESYITNLEVQPSEVVMEVNDNVSIDENMDTPLRVSNRKALSFTEGKNNCIVCDAVKKERGRVIPTTQITLRDNKDKFHKAEEKLKEFAKIHIENNNEEYLHGARRIQLQLSTGSLFAADVSYHPSCYERFRSPGWKRS